MKLLLVNTCQFGGSTRKSFQSKLSNYTVFPRYIFICSHHIRWRPTQRHPIKLVCSNVSASASDNIVRRMEIRFRHAKPLANNTRRIFANHQYQVTHEPEVYRFFLSKNIIELVTEEKTQKNWHKIDVNEMFGSHVRCSCVSFLWIILQLDSII